MLLLENLLRWDKKVSSEKGSVVANNKPETLKHPKPKGEYAVRLFNALVPQMEDGAVREIVVL